MGIVKKVVDVFISKKSKPVTTNAEFAGTDETFLNACNMVSEIHPKLKKNTDDFVEFQPTARQASKWRMKKGIAYKTVHNIPLNPDKKKK